MKIEMPKVRQLPPVFVNVEHYFNWCDIQEKQFRDRVARNPKAQAAALKLAEWHIKNPDKAVANVFELRARRALRKLA